MSSPQPSPHAAMMQMISAYYVSQALGAVARLRVADHLETPKTAEELGRELKCDARTLYRVLRGLGSVGVFTEDANQRFSLTPLGATLKSGPASMRPVAAYHCSEVFWHGAENLRWQLQTGKPSFMKDQGTDNVFDVINKHPEAAEDFAEAMTTFSTIDAMLAVQSYDFSRFRVVCDVGGGQGNFIATVLGANPKVRGMLLDQPSVVKGAPALLTARGVDPARVQVHGGSFFDKVPEGADCYVLANILHDWNDAHCTQILKSVRKAMKPGATLVINEIIIPPSVGHAAAPGKVLDLTLLLVGGAVRTQEEYEALFKATGFRLARIVPTRAATSVVEAKAV